MAARRARRGSPVARRARSGGFVALLLLGLAGCGGGTSEPPPAPANAVPAGTKLGSAAITGRVTLAGAPPRRAAVRMSGEAGCRKPGAPEALSEDLVVSADGGVRDVWVRVASGLGERAFAPPAAEVDIDQSGCLFVPHVVMAQTNQKVTLRNSDALVHNVHALARANPVFNVSLPGQGRSITRYFPHPEAVRVKCDLHTWMGGYIVVGASPYQTLTSDDGRFALRGLPAGTYDIEAWQETLGTKRLTVTLSEGETKTLDVAFEAPAGGPAARR